MVRLSVLRGVPNGFPKDYLIGNRLFKEFATPASGFQS